MLAQPPTAVGRGRALAVLPGIASSGHALADPVCPWNFPGKNAGVGCLFLNPGIKAGVSCISYIGRQIPYRCTTTVQEQGNPAQPCNVKSLPSPTPPAQLPAILPLFSSLLACLSSSDEWVSEHAEYP